MASGGWGLLTVVLLLLLWSVLIYHRLLLCQRAVEHAFAEIDQLLQRRYTLIAHWVDVARQHLPQEAANLEMLTRARSHAVGAVATARVHPGQPGAMAALSMAEGALSAQFQRLQPIAQEPLQADARSAALRADIAAVEAELTQARAAYNVQIQGYNRQTERWPDWWLARLLGFAPLNAWDASAQAPEHVVPQLHF